MLNVNCNMCGTAIQSGRSILSIYRCGKCNLKVIEAILNRNR